MTTKEEQMIITKYDLLFESRLSKVESTIDHLNKGMDDIKVDMRGLKSEFRWLFGLILVLGGMMAKGFGWY